MTVFTQTEFRVQMEQYLDMGMTYRQACMQACADERELAEQIRSVQLELID